MRYFLYSLVGTSSRNQPAFVADVIDSEDFPTPDELRFHAKDQDINSSIVLSVSELTEADAEKYRNQ